MKSKKSVTTALVVQLILLAMAVPAVSYESGFEENNNASDIVTFEHYETDPVAKSKIIDRRIEKGLNYLYENQLTSGEFPTYISYSQDMRDAKNWSEVFGKWEVVFDTAFIFHTLNLVDTKENEEIVNETKTKAIAFLLSNRESHGVWRYTGKNGYNMGPPDNDDTSLVFAALVESGVNVSDETLDYMLNFRTPDGVFYTWMNTDEWIDPSNIDYWFFKTNDIDASVNSNVLYAYSLRNRSPRELVPYINGIAKNRLFLNGTIYYPSPFAFAYLVTKAYSDGNVRELKPAVAEIKDYILETQNHDGGWGNDLDTAFATVSLINMDYNGKPLEKAINHILRNQRKNGSWGIYSIYRVPATATPFDPSIPLIYYGSHELTTSFSIEALIKYKKTIESDFD